MSDSLKAPQAAPLAATTEEGRIELNEEELTCVSGGTVRKAGEQPLEF